VAAGRLVGGAGGVGLERTVAPFAPLVLAAGGGGGVGRMTGAGAGAGISSLRYAEGTHPWVEPFLASHQPWSVSFKRFQWQNILLTIRFFLDDGNDIPLFQAQFVGALTIKCIESTIRRIFSFGRGSGGRWRWNRSCR
jgi:hypothetical protein